MVTRPESADPTLDTITAKSATATAPHRDEHEVSASSPQHPPGAEFWAIPHSDDCQQLGPDLIRRPDGKV